MNDKATTCHDYHGFKWQNMNIYPILIIFLCGAIPFLAHWIMIAPKSPFVRLKICKTSFGPLVHLNLKISKWHLHEKKLTNFLKILIQIKTIEMINEYMLCTPFKL
jgi:hypothetical protein